MGYTIRDVAEAWADSGGQLLRRVRRNSHDSISTDGVALWSYGTAIATYLEDGTVLHSGDRFGVATSNHQRAARGAGDGPQVPFSALREFRVPVGGVTIVERTPDWVGFWCQECRKEVESTRCECGKPASYRHRLGAVVFNHQDRYFLGAWDEQETSGRCYFVTELPKMVGTYDEAMDSLLPDEVRGHDYRRQGDIFVIPRPEMEKVPEEWVTHKQRVFDTNHVATTAAVAPYAPGRLFVRGALYHRPAWRRPDHAPMFHIQPWHEAFVNVSRKMGLRTFGFGGQVD